MILKMKKSANYLEKCAAEIPDDLLIGPCHCEDRDELQYSSKSENQSDENIIAFREACPHMDIERVLNFLDEFPLHEAIRLAKKLCPQVIIPNWVLPEHVVPLEKSPSKDELRCVTFLPSDSTTLFDETIKKDREQKVFGTSIKMDLNPRQEVVKCPSKDNNLEKEIPEPVKETNTVNTQKTTESSNTKATKCLENSSKKRKIPGDETREEPIAVKKVKEEPLKLKKNVATVNKNSVDKNDKKIKVSNGKVQKENIKPKK